MPIDIPDSLTGRLHWASITERSKSEKKQYLGQTRANNEFINLFTQHDIAETSKGFRPTERIYNREMYERFWAIHKVERNSAQDELYIFKRHCSGTKLAPTALFVHTSKSILRRRSQEIGDMSKTYNDLHSKWYLGQKKPPNAKKMTPDVRSRIRIAAGRNISYRRSAFRPFLSVHLLLDNELLRLLSGVEGGGTRLRPEVVSAFSHEETVGIAIAPSPIDIGEDLHRFTTFCWDMPDNDLCSRGNAHVFCNQFPEYKPPLRNEWDPTPVNNINDRLLEAMKELVPEITSIDIVFYAYAVMCSSRLLEAFAAAYYTASAEENIPRIPIVNDPKAIQELVYKGKQLAALENPRANPELIPWTISLDSLFQEPFILKKYDVDEKKGEIRLYSEGTDPKISLPDIPEEILQLTISGYGVITCWLKFHSFTYTRTQFTRSDYREFLALLSALSKQSEIVEQIDLCMDRILSGKLGLLTLSTS